MKTLNKSMMPFLAICAISLLGPMGASQVLAQHVDPAAVHDTHSLTMTRHVNSAFNAATADAGLTQASLELLRCDSEVASDQDVGCQVTVQRTGAVGTFGAANDGLDVITTNAELQAVLGQGGGWVKVVTFIGWCGGAGNNIIGCAPVPGTSLVIVNGLTNNTTGRVIVHEFGHNQGLSHRSTPGNPIMQPTIGGDEVDLTECAAFHNGNTDGVNGPLVNLPPNITCPTNVTVECTETGGTTSSNPDIVNFLAAVTGDDGCEDVTFTNNAPAFFPMGDTEVTFTATDNDGAETECSATVTVEDTTPPEIFCPGPIIVECEAAGGTPATNAAIQAFLAGASATDICDPTPTIGDNAPTFFEGPCEGANGVTTVTFTATDDSGNSAQCQATVTVEDTTSPEIMVTVEPEVLWPPNHKMVEVEYTVTVSDICDDDSQWVLVSVVSDEPDNGRGDGNTVDDIQDADLGTPDNLVSLRSERSGAEDGRVYTATFEVTDCSGNSSETTCNVYVPHSASDFVTIVSSGALPGTSPGAAFMISGATLWEDEVPVEVNGDFAGEINFVEPVSAFITNTAGLVRPNAFFVKDVDFDEYNDVLVGFDVDELAELIAISTPEDGDPAMVLKLGEDHFLVLDLSRVEGTDLDLPGMIDELRGLDSVEGQLVQNDPNPVRVAGLIGAAPNPFNPTTKISFYIPDSRHVELAIFDISGRRVARLVSQTMSAGEHSVMWHGKDASGGPVASGVYFYQLTAGQLVETKRMIMVK